MTKNSYSKYKLAWFPDKLNSLKFGNVIEPINIRIKPTNRCCHNCYFCVYRHEISSMHEHCNRTDEIPLYKMNEIIEDITQMGVQGITWSGGGETLVHKNIIEILETTIKNKLNFSLITNGQKIYGDIAELLKRSKWIRVSMDYYSSESFIESKRGSDSMFNDLCKNIKSFTSNTDHDIGVNYIITEKNYKFLEESIKLVIDLGFKNIRYSPIWTPNFEEYHQYLFHTVIHTLKELREKYSDQIQIYDSYKIAEKALPRTYSKCYFQQVVPVIGADLNVYNCHNTAYTDHGLMGSIKDIKFSELWNSETIKTHFDTFNPIEKCNHECANDAKNKYINELMNCYGDCYV